MKLESIIKTARNLTQSTKSQLVSFGVLSLAYFFIFSTQVAYAGWLGTLISIGKWIAYIVITITVIGYLLWAAGNMFDISLQKTVLDFSGMLGSASTPQSLMSSIHTIWTASRDIANILIIGMFVYVALNKILGTKQNFNKIIVSLLSVAVLINFSFFFTQVAIDISNWSAVQVYNAISSDDAVAGTVTLSKKIVDNMKGVAMGYGIWFETAAAFKGTDWKTYVSYLPNVIIVSILTLMTAILFFRMTFILVGRWIVLVILMATSSLAFAAMLIPSLKSYWEQWYKALIYNSIVAPLLLLLLWAATLIMVGVSEKFKLFGAKFKNVDMSKMATNTDIVSNFMDGLIGFALMIGLLWATIRIATMLSNKAASSAGGLGKFVNSALGKVEGLGYRGLSSGLGLAGRNTYGLGFSGMASALESHAGKFASSKGIGRLYGDTIGAMSKMAKKRGEKSLDLRNTNLMKDFGKSAGVSMGKANTEGFQALADRREKERDERKKNQQTRAETAQEGTAEIVNTLTKRREDNEDLAKNQQEILKANKTKQDELTKAITDDEKEIGIDDANIKTKEAELGAVRTKRDEAAQAYRDATGKGGKLKSEINEQEAKIKNLLTRGDGKKNSTPIQSHLESLKTKQASALTASTLAQATLSQTTANLINLNSTIAADKVTLKGKEKKLEDKKKQTSDKLKKLESDAKEAQKILNKYGSQVLATQSEIDHINAGLQEVAEGLSSVKQFKALSKHDDARLEELQAIDTAILGEEEVVELGTLLKRKSDREGVISGVVNRFRQTSSQRSKADKKSELSDFILSLQEGKNTVLQSNFNKATQKEASSQAASDAK